MLDRLDLWPMHRDDMVYENLSASTVKMRGHVLGALSEQVDLADATADDLRHYLARRTRTGKPLSPGTRKAYHSHLKTFYGWAVFNEHLEVSPCDKLKTVRARRGEPRPLPLADLTKALAAAGPRPRMWLMLAAYAGLRCSEAAAIHARDFDRTGPVTELRVVGKGEKPRWVPIPPEVDAELLADWPTTGYLFPSTGEHVTGAHVSRSVNELLRAIGSEYTAHKARHLYCTSMAGQEGADLLVVMEVMGHASVATTQIYAKPNRSKLHRLVAGLDYSVRTA